MPVSPSQGPVAQTLLPWALFGRVFLKFLHLDTFDPLLLSALEFLEQQLLPPLVMDAPRACHCEQVHCATMTNASESCDTELIVKLIYSLKLVAGSNRSLDACKLVPQGAGKIPRCTESWLFVCYGSSIG